MPRRGFLPISTPGEQLSAWRAGQPIQLRVRGARATIANIYSAQEAIVEEMREATRSASRDTRSLAYQLCPVDTTRMRESLTEELSPDELAFNVFFDPLPFLADGVAYYPPFVEFGTENMEAQPSLMPAYREMDSIYRSDIAAAARRAIRKSAI